MSLSVIPMPTDRPLLAAAALPRDAVAATAVAYAESGAELLTLW